MSNAGTTERRRRERISAGKGAYAFSGKQYGQIVDVNLKGLCFQYAAGAGWSGEGNITQERGEERLDIIFGAYDFTLVGLPVQTVADFRIPSPEAKAGNLMVRRRAVTFGELTSEQVFSLKRFLLLSQYGAARPPGKSPEKEAEGANRQEETEE